MTTEKGVFLTLKGGNMKYIKVILTIIAALLPLNVFSRCFVVPVTAQYEGIQDVNIATIQGSYVTLLLVKIVE